MAEDRSLNACDHGSHGHGTRAGSSLQEIVREMLDDYYLAHGATRPSNVYRFVMAEVEKGMLETVMRHTEGNQCQAARELGISRGNLRSKLQRYNLA